MSDWDSKMEALRRRFVDRTLGERTMLADREQMETVAHRISGSAGMFGYAALGQAAEALENAVREDGSDEDLRELVARLEAEIDRLQPR